MEASADTRDRAARGTASRTLGHIPNRPAARMPNRPAAAANDAAGRAARGALGRPSGRTPSRAPSRMPEGALDPIPREGEVHVSGPDDAGLMTARLFAFNTAVSLSAYGDEPACRAAFSEAVAACRTYERLFSRTLPHSDIARVNAAGGARVRIDPRTFDLLTRALRYCARSEGAFDVTVGPLVRLWDFRAGIAPDARALAQAAAHVGWEKLVLAEEPGTPARHFAQLADEAAAVDVGGIAKGWVADELDALMGARGLSGYIINLGGNVVVRGSKPGGAPWRVGVRNPNDPRRLAGAVPLASGSAVTSGTYERCFTAPDGTLCHHVLDPRTGMPVRTDAASATVIAEKSIDAEGFSTTLLALGTERGSALARRCPEILQVVFVTDDGRVTTLR
ncbi:FAD:protein FMN transferase [Adlercreutzia sp. ZJ473]|uniref:FAD:protein FMN transferase n=1 Tax=Adlercreutzia sp. ZJ473 TaxID=2722822 RepID=UPI0020A6ADA6|nr:FAD:protein FMN transferase [Adlercreutzia sp. ZJ473]